MRNSTGSGSRSIAALTPSRKRAQNLALSSRPARSTGRRPSRASERRARLRPLAGRQSRRLRRVRRARNAAVNPFERAGRSLRRSPARRRDRARFAATMCGTPRPSRAIDTGARSASPETVPSTRRAGVHADHDIDEKPGDDQDDDQDAARRRRAATLRMRSP